MRSGRLRRVGTRWREERLWAGSADIMARRRSASRRAGWAEAAGEARRSRVVAARDLRVWRAVLSLRAASCVMSVVTWNKSVGVRTGRARRAAAAKAVAREVVSEAGSLEGGR